MSTQTAATTVELFVVIRKDGVGWWDWDVYRTQAAADACASENRTTYKDRVAHGFSTTRLTARWSARRACRDETHGRRVERWTFTREPWKPAEDET